MIALYATWAAMPTFIARIRERVRGSGILLAVLGAAVCAFQDPDANKDREVYNFLINAIAADDVFAMEPGFYALVKLLALGLQGPDLELAFYFIVAFASLSIKLPLFARYGGSLFGCLAAFFSYFFLLHEMTQVRVGLAIGLLYMSWFAYADGRRGAYWMFGVLAFLFHFSGAVFVVAPLLLSVRERSKWLIGLLVLACAGAVSVLAGRQVLLALESLSNTLGIERLQVYFELLREGVLVDISPVRLIPHALLLLVMGVTWGWWRQDRLTFLMFQIYLFGFLIFIALWPIPALAYRMSDLFLFAGVFVLGRLRLFLTPSLYYPFILAYTGVFLVYTLEFSGLFVKS